MKSREPQPGPPAGASKKDLGVWFFNSFLTQTNVYRLPVADFDYYLNHDDRKANAPDYAYAFEKYYRSTQKFNENFIGTPQGEAGKEQINANTHGQPGPSRESARIEHGTGPVGELSLKDRIARRDTRSRGTYHFAADDHTGHKPMLVQRDGTMHRLDASVHDELPDGPISGRIGRMQSENSKSPLSGRSAVLTPSGDVFILDKRHDGDFDVNDEPPVLDARAVWAKPVGAAG